MNKLITTQAWGTYEVTYIRTSEATNNLIIQVINKSDESEYNYDIEEMVQLNNPELVKTFLEPHYNHVLVKAVIPFGQINDWDLPRVMKGTLTPTDILLVKSFIRDM